MKKAFLFVLCLALTCTLSNASIYDRSEILKIMKKVANHTRYTSNDWLDATYYTGIVAAYKASLDTAYLNQVESWGQEHNWLRYPGSEFPNDIACGQAYAELFLLDSSAANQYKIADMNAVYDQMSASAEPGRTIWSWCDALFMAPPMLARIARIKG